MDGTDSDDLLVFFKSDMLNADLSELSKGFYKNSSDNLIFDK